MITEQRLIHTYTYHPPCKTAIPKFTKLREKALELSLLMHDLCPESREHSVSQTKLEEVIMWANASIARNECSVMSDTDAEFNEVGK